MKKAVIVSMFMLLGASLLAAQDTAVSIMNSARNRAKYDSISSVSRMVITARNGTTTERVIEQHSKDGPLGSRTVIIFQRPANVAGTRFRTMKNASGGSDIEIYLPELDRRRRIAAQESGGSFMGTDFSYDDMSFMDRDVALDNHTLAREESLNGRVCYVIRSVPLSGTWQYSATVSWIDKENYLIYKMEMYNNRNELIKVMEMSDFRDVQGRVTPMQTKLSTVAAGTFTTIYIENLRYDAAVPEEIFSNTFLETGRLR